MDVQLKIALPIYGYSTWSCDQKCGPLVTYQDSGVAMENVRGELFIISGLH